jgi:hypothetical protein
VQARPARIVAALARATLDGLDRDEQSLFSALWLEKYRDRHHHRSDRDGRPR